jgi:CheY-like chemotaxis protein
LQGKTVLLVDDEETVRRVGASMLERLGCQVETAPDGRAAIEIFAENPSRFDCVILDLTMPRMGGEECFERLREIRDDVVVVLTSGYSEQELVDRVAGRGMAGFLQKPYLYEVFTATLMRVCR